VLFNSVSFAAFFGVVFVVYWTIRHHRARLAWLLAASTFFYAAWYPAYVLLFGGALAINFLATRAMASRLEESRPVARRFLVALIVADLATLGGFKYADFALRSLAAMVDWVPGVSWQPPELGIFLPLGISFYTFQMIAYAVDLWRGECAPIRNPLKFALFISFFPQLIAGPIVRANEFVDQLATRREFDRGRLMHGLDLIALGLFKKILVADQLAPFAEHVFGNPEAAGLVTSWLAVYAYAAQIYCDFSGYTDIGRGCAYMLGFELPRNFRAPYLSGNITEFWRRWHMTLSNWLRDYLYIPLGGNRGSTASTYRNLFLTMALGGLWHGASWNFVLWGSLHGVALVILRAVHSARGMSPSAPLFPGRLYRGLAILATFHFVAFLWIFFRAESFADAIVVLSHLFQPTLLTAADRSLGYFTLAATAAGIGASAVLHIAVWQATQRGATRWAAYRWLRPVGWASIAIAISLFASRGAQQFIYFQF